VGLIGNISVISDTAATNAADEPEAVAPRPDEDATAGGDRGAAPRVDFPEDGGAPAFDQMAESAYLAEARARGEVAAAAATKAVVEAEESSSLPLPRLDELVERIPAEVRETLEDLFRARFVTVKRFPRKALKS
jgi:hypothetical protein